MRIITFLMAAVLLFHAAAGLSAEDQEAPIEIDVDDVVIEGEEYEPDSRITPGQVTVFDREAIEASGAATVADVIDAAPGVIVSRQGGILEPQRVSIRGGEFGQVLVLINGEPAGSLWSGGTDLALIPLDSVERIEVIRGAAAAIYGEGAFSGVINIITADASGSPENFEVEYGFASFNTHRLDAKISGSLSDEAGLSGLLSAGGLYTGGGYEYETPDGTVQRLNNDGYSVNMSGDLDWEPSDTVFELDFSGDFYMSEKGTPGLMEFLTPEARMEDMRWQAGIGLDYDAAAAGLFSLDIGGIGMYSSYTNPDDDIDDCNDNTGLNAKAGWRLPFEIEAVFFDLRLSGGYSYDYLYSTALTDSTGSSLDGAAFQHKVDARMSCVVEWEQFDLTPAVAVDWVSQEYAADDTGDDSAFTWSVSAGWSPFRTDIEEGPLYLKLNTGTAYRNPSFQDLFWPSGALASGNPDLLPEHSFSWDAGFFLSFDEPDINIEAVYFMAWAENLIQWLPSAGGVWRPDNIGSALNSGLETSAAWRADNLFELFDLELSAVYNLLSSIDNTPDSVNNGNQLAYRPMHSGNLSLIFEFFESLKISTELSYIGVRYTNNANTKDLDPVLIMSAAVSYEFDGNFSLSASADNITDVQYIDRLGYPVPGVEWALKGRLSL